jgi:hypothetical protein
MRRDGEGLFHAAAMPDSGCGMPSFLHHLAGSGPGPRPGRWCRARCPGWGRPPRFQFRGDVERCLTAELDDHALGFFLLVNAEHVFHGERLEVELVRGVVVGGHGFRVAVDHDGFNARVPDGEGRVHAAVVELDALPDAVGAAAQHHDLGPVADRHLVRRRCRWSSNRPRHRRRSPAPLPGLHQAQFNALVAESPFREHVQQLPARYRSAKPSFLACFSRSSGAGCPRCSRIAPRAPPAPSSAR